METSKYSITPPQCENENISMEGKFLSTHEKTLNMIVCRITKSLAIWSWAPICTKSGRSERAGQGISGVIRQLLPRTYLLKFIFALNRGFLPWIFGAGLKSGSAYALVDLVSLAPLSILNLESYQHSQFRTKNFFSPTLCALVCSSRDAIAIPWNLWNY